MSIEFNFSDDFKSENSISDDQLSAISNQIKDQIADHEKTLNFNAQKNAQNIIAGSAQKTMKLTGIPMNDGEHHGDYLSRVGDQFLESQKKELSAAKKIYEDKVSNFKGEDELRSLQEKVSIYQQKEAQYDELLNSGIKEKYESLSNEHTSLMKKQAYASVMPSFNENVNKYEADYKISEVKAEIENAYDIKLVENVWLAIDKNNEYKQKPLSELVNEHPTIKSLTEGRKQQGFKTTKVEPVTINGLEIPKDATGKEAQEKIREHLTKKYNGNSSRQYGVEFKKMLDEWSKEK